MKRVHLTALAKGQPVLSMRELQALARAVRMLQRGGNRQGISDSTGLHQRPTARGQPDWFIGKVYNLGPASEVNYTNQRYWVIEQQFTNSGDADTTDIAWDNATDPVWVTATNLAEVISGSHDFPDNSSHRVLVYRAFDQSGVARYVFNSLAIVVD